MWVINQIITWDKGGGTPSHHGCFNTTSWSSMTWMIGSTRILGTPKLINHHGCITGIILQGILPCGKLRLSNAFEFGFTGL